MQQQPPPTPAIVYFLSNLNVTHVTNDAFRFATGLGYAPDLGVFRQRIPEMMHTWAQQQCALRFDVTVGNGAGSEVSDIVQTVEFMNHAFLASIRDVIVGEPGAQGQSQPDVFLGVRNPRARNESGLYVTTGTINEYEYTRSKVDMGQMMASDYQTLDVWGPSQAFLWDNRARQVKSTAVPPKSCAEPLWSNGQKPRFWVQQETGRNRYHDRDNEGFRDSKEHSERPTQMHGYDMSDVMKTISGRCIGREHQCRERTHVYM